MPENLKAPVISGFFHIRLSPAELFPTVVNIGVFLARSLGKQWEASASCLPDNYLLRTLSNFYIITVIAAVAGGKSDGRN